MKMNKTDHEIAREAADSLELMLECAGCWHDAHKRKASNIILSAICEARLQPSEDSARLDWLEHYLESPPLNICIHFGGKSFSVERLGLRGAIDAARGCPQLHRRKRKKAA
jgi:hypothetical protein